MLGHTFGSAKGSPRVWKSGTGLDFRLPLPCLRDLRSAGILRSVEWQSFTDVSGKHVGPIFKGQEVQEVHFLTLEDGADTFFRNVGKGLPLDAA
jgi:hypothetical protein